MSTDTNGNKIVTNGNLELRLGDYINYDPITGAKKLSYKSLAQKNGAQEQVFVLKGENADDAVSYDTSKSGWKVIGVNVAGEILIVSEDLILPVTGGSTYKNVAYYQLVGLNGYEHGIEELEAICSLYGQGKHAIGSRSITIEDINKITGYNPNNVGKYDPKI